MGLISYLIFFSKFRLNNLKELMINNLKVGFAHLIIINIYAVTGIFVFSEIIESNPSGGAKLDKSSAL